MRQQDIQGLKYFRLLDGLLDGLRNDATERDRSNNRKLFYDQYVTLLLMYFCTPALDSLRALQQASGLKKVQKLLGVPRCSLGSLSEAPQVFDADLLKLSRLSAAGIFVVGSLGSKRHAIGAEFASGVRLRATAKAI